MITVFLVHSRYQMERVLLFLLAFNLTIWFAVCNLFRSYGSTSVWHSGSISTENFRLCFLSFDFLFYFEKYLFSRFRSLTLPSCVTCFIILLNWFNLFCISLICISNQHLPVFCPVVHFSFLNPCFMPWHGLLSDTYFEK